MGEGCQEAVTFEASRTCFSHWPSPWDFTGSTGVQGTSQTRGMPHRHEVHIDLDESDSEVQLVVHGQPLVVGLELVIRALPWMRESGEEGSSVNAVA